MTIIEQSHKIIQSPVEILQFIEAAGRTCYKSEDKITAGSAEEFTKMIIRRGHESVLEHVSISVRFITNRGVTHELVRHRICAFSQESTRYVKYDDNMEFIKPVWWDSWNNEKQTIWTKTMESLEKQYQALIQMGVPPQEAREILPNSLKTEIVVTANVREWRHIFKLRCAKGAHPQMRSLMLQCEKDFQSNFPILFDEQL